MAYRGGRKGVRTRVMTNSGLIVFQLALCFFWRFSDPPVWLYWGEVVAGLVKHVQEDGFFGESSDSRHFAGKSVNIGRSKTKKNN